MSMGTWLLAGAGLIVVLWLFLRGSGRSSSGSSRTASKPVTAARVSRPSSKGAHSAELPAAMDDGIQAPPELVRDVPAVLADFELIVAAPEQPSTDRVNGICHAMGDPHPVHRQLATGLDTPEDLTEAVTSDPGLTASILRTVNSAAYALSSPITSVQHAITYLGVSAVKSLVTQAAVGERLEPGPPEEQAALMRVWRSAGVASLFAQTLGKELGIERPSVLATKALFFNLGDVAIVRSVDGAVSWYDPEMDLVGRIEAQQQACAANTALVGAALARQWALPEDLARSIETGYLPLAFEPDAFPLSGESYSTSVLLYLAGRAGDRVVYSGLRDIGDLELRGSDDADLFYLAAHLQSVGLGRALDILQNTAFRRKLNRQMQPLAGS